MRVVTPDSFIAKIREIARTEETLFTLKLGRPFKCAWNGKRWVFIPQRTKGERRIEPPILEKVVGRFNKTGSLRPCDYLETKNGSYYCAVFKDMTE